MSEESQAQQVEPEVEEQTASPAEIAILEVEVAKARDEMLRALAEVENVRRRAEREKQDARTYAIDRFARDLLPVADTLGRALLAAEGARETADDATRTLLAGIEMTERALQDAFTRHGLKRVGAKGDVFDPNLHQAVAQAPADVPAGHVAEVMQPGYALGDRVVRAAMVLVSSGQAPAPASTEHVDIKV